MARPAALAAVPDDSRPVRDRPLPETQDDLQAAVEGAQSGDHVEFMGATYRIAGKVGLMPLMRFGYIAKQGANADDMDGLAAMYALIRDCIHPDDWDRFEQDATEKRADADDLFKMVQQTIELLTARPTSRPSDSSAGPSSTSQSLTASSSSPDEATGADEIMAVPDLLRRAEAN